MNKKLLLKLSLIVLISIPLLMVCNKTCIAGWFPMISGTSERLKGVWGSSENDVFAVGDHGTILHYNGSEWTSMNSGTSEDLLGIWGISGSDIFALGRNYTILHYNGSNWSSMEGGLSWLFSAWGSSGNNVFAVGSGGAIIHYNGSTWTTALPGTIGTFFDIWGNSGSDIFAVGRDSSDEGIIFHYDGNTWTPINIETVGILFGVWGTSGSDIFAVGDNSTILHYNGTTWSPMNSGATSWLLSVWGSSPIDVFAVGGDGTIVHYDGLNWAEMQTPTNENLEDVWGISESNFFAVGWGGTILHYENVACQSDTACDDGKYCNGIEICDIENETCLPGTPVSCPDGQTCDEDSNQCVEEPCTIAVNPSFATIFTWEAVQFSATVDGACNEPCYTWEIAAGGCTGNTTGSSIGSTIDANGIYRADGMAGVDVVRAIDECNGNICDSATVQVMITTTTTTTTPTIPCIPDNYEPDEFPPEVNSIAPDSCQHRSICPAGDVDWVEFELTAESGITLETSGPWGGTIMCLTDNDLNMIECDYDGGPDMWSYIQQPCLPAGTYYFGIAEYAYGVIPEYEVCLTTHPCPPPVELDCTQLLASSQFGELFRIDVTTGSSEFIGYMPPTLATEIEYDVLAGTLYAEEVDGLQYLHTIDPGRGFSTGFVAHDYGSLQGLEFVGSTLYGTFFPDSTLVIVDTATGALTTVGSTGLAQISGLAYDKGTDVMYGITAGGGPAHLVTIDLTTGAATVVGPTGLDRIGSIEFGPDGNLYGGVTAFGSAYATYLVRIDTSTGGATPIGETGFSITGLTSCQSGIDIIFDIKPDPLNLKCKGVMPAAIVGTDEFNVRSIDPDSLKLTREGVTDGVAPIRYNFTDKESGDMLLKFRVPEVVEVLMLDELAGQTIPLTITGITADGSFISGQDYVRLLGNIVEECNADFDCDADVDGSDALTFKDNFGRSSIQNPCTDANPCDGDFDKDRDVDGNDAFIFKSDYGRILWW